LQTNSKSDEFVNLKTHKGAQLVVKHLIADVIFSQKPKVNQQVKASSISVSGKDRTWQQKSGQKA
jgi:uncharacterized protein YajQ (UPF0234 family)